MWSCGKIKLQNMTLQAPENKVSVVDPNNITTEEFEK